MWIKLARLIFLKVPTHYTRYGMRCRVDGNISIKMWKIVFCETRKAFGDVVEKNVCLAPSNANDLR